MSLTARLNYVGRFPASSCGVTGWKRWRGLGDLQVAADVGEHDPIRRLARSARNGKCRRLPCRQYRVELPRALPRSHDYLKAVGLVEAVDQGGGALMGLRPMSGHGS